MLKPKDGVIYPAICSSCYDEVKAKMMTSYSIRGECCRCGSLDSLSIVEEIEKCLGR